MKTLDGGGMAAEVTETLREGWKASFVEICF